jgi:putative ABC transport system permease protein
MMDALLLDLRYALRALRRNPGFTLVAVLTLALGIGANTAIFSLVDAVLLRPLPYRDADRLVAVWGARGQDRQVVADFSDVMEWRARNRSFEEMGVVRGQSINLTGGDTPERLSGEFVTAATFSVLGVSAARGRLFTPEETTPGTGREVAVLSDASWRNRFGADSAIVGRTLILNGRPHVVIGVTPKGYESPFSPIDVWLPITSIPSAATFQRGNANVWALGRLKPGVSVEQAQRDLTAIAGQLAVEFPATNAGVGAEVLSLRDQVVGDSRRMLLTIMGAVVLVLLVACANVASLQLARATGRRHEISVRAALGAGRTRIARQLLTESVLLSLIGGACGAGLAVWAVAALVAAVPGGLPAFGPVTLDRTALLYATGVSLACGVGFGLAPAWFATRTGLGEALRLRPTEAAPARRFDVRSLFVAGELAACIVLLVSAGLLARSMVRLQQVEPGFAPDHVLTFQFRLPSSKYREPAQIAAFFARAVDEVRAVRGVTSAALVTATPFTGNWSSTGYVVAGGPASDPGREPVALSLGVTPGYFRTMQIPVLSGRDFDATDRVGSAGVAIVSRELAGRAWPGSSPLGRQIRPAGDSVWLTVVGVVGNAKHLTLREEWRPQLYRPSLQAPFIFSNVVARTEGDPLALAKSVRAAIWAVDREQPVWRITSMEGLLERALRPVRFTMLLTGAFAALALLLGAIGVYGVMSHLVQQRTREVGIRLAVGARPAQVIRMVLAQGLRVAAVAAVVGLLAAAGVAQLLAGQLFGITTTDPVTYAGVTLVLGVAAALACWLPARRAARTDPMIALRSE